MEAFLLTLNAQIEIILIPSLYMPFSPEWSLMWNFKMSLLDANSTREDCGIGTNQKTI